MARCAQPRLPDVRLFQHLTGVDLKRRFTVICRQCEVECKRFGKDRNGVQRFRCRQGFRTFLEPHQPRQRPLGRMYTALDDAVQVLSLMIEGMSVASIQRHEGMHHTTVLSLLLLAGERCERLATSRIRNIPCKDQCDEIWGFPPFKRRKRTNGRGKRTTTKWVMPIASSLSSATRSWS